jgi:hypothetical protein
MNQCLTTFVAVVVLAFNTLAVPLREAKAPTSIMPAPGAKQMDLPHCFGGAPPDSGL